jgi:hypothetical protein
VALRRAPPATDEPLREQTITLRLTVHRAPHIFAPSHFAPSPVARVAAAHPRTPAAERSAGARVTPARNCLVVGPWVALAPSPTSTTPTSTTPTSTTPWAARAAVP